MPGTFALYNPKYGDYTPALAQLRDDLSSLLQKNLFDDGLISKTLTDLALFQAYLVDIQAKSKAQPGPLRKPVIIRDAAAQPVRWMDTRVRSSNEGPSTKARRSLRQAATSSAGRLAAA
jgi:hypothetical protein